MSAGKKIFSSALAAGTALVPRAASACAVCTAGRDDETQLAFLLTTAFLSVLPVAAVGGFVWWLARRARRLDRERAERAMELAPGVSRASSSS